MSTKNKISFMDLNEKERQDYVDLTHRLIEVEMKYPAGESPYDDDFVPQRTTEEILNSTTPTVLKLWNGT